MTGTEIEICGMSEIAESYCPSTRDSETGEWTYTGKPSSIFDECYNPKTDITGTAPLRGRDGTESRESETEWRGA